jgi:hypothetical protein
VRANFGKMAVRALRKRGSEMSVQRQSCVSTGSTRDDPAVIQICAEWRKDGSGLRQGPGRAYLGHCSERVIYRVDLRAFNFDLVLGFGFAVFHHALLACKLLVDESVMDSNNTNFRELTMPAPRTSRMSRNGAKRRRVKVPLSSGGDRRRPAIGTLARTRTLILAALRVWELKQGIRS